MPLLPTREGGSGVGRRGGAEESNAERRLNRGSQSSTCRKPGAEAWRHWGRCTGRGASDDAGTAGWLVMLEQSGEEVRTGARCCGAW